MHPISLLTMISIIHGRDHVWSNSCRLETDRKKEMNNLAVIALASIRMIL